MKRVMGVLIVAACALTATPAFALKGFWHYYDPECPVAIGPTTMKFVALQPKVGIERVCDALANTGHTVIALDAPDAELRDMTWDIRILKDEKDEGEPDVNASTVFRLPAAKYKNGMVNFDVMLKDAGKYVLALEALSDDGSKKYSGYHRFTAGLFDAAEIYAFIGFGLFAVLAGAGAFTLWRRGKLGFKIPNFSKPL